jgi:HK97 family phage major capsid protein
MSRTAELETRLGEIKTRMKEMDADVGTKAMSEEQRTEFEGLRDDRKETERLIEELNTRTAWVEEGMKDATRQEDGATFQTRRQGTTSGEDIWDLSTVRSSVSSPEEATRELRDRALKAVEVSTYPHEDAKREKVQGHIERLLETAEHEDGRLSRYLLATGSPQYKSAFPKLIQPGGPSMLTREEQVAVAQVAMAERAMSLTGASGGFAVPFVLDPTIIPTSNGVLNPIRQIADVKTITVDEWRGVTSAGVTAAYGAEAAVSTDNSPTLVQPTISTEKARAFVPFSIEIGQDWSSFQSEMAKLFQIAKDELEGDKFWTGSGTNEPFGVLTGATNTVNTNTTLVLAAADLYKVSEALPPRYESGASIVMSKFIADKIRQFDTGGGANLWTYLGGGTPPQLVGYPAYTASALASSLAVAAKEILIGDFSRFVIIDRVGMNVELIPHIFGAAQGNLPTGQRGLYAYWRNGAKVVDANAFRLLLGL